MNENTEERAGRRTWVLRGAIVAALLAILIAGGMYFLHSLSHESTDDAFVSGVVVPVSAEVRGRVVTVYIRDNQSVAAGAPLLEIFKGDYRDALQQKDMAAERLKAEEDQIRASIEQGAKALQQAQAGLEAARAEEALADRDKARYDNLIRMGVISRSQYDAVQSRWQVAEAGRKSAEAGVAEAAAALKALESKVATQAYSIREAEAARSIARLDLERTLIRAPVSGRIAMKNVDPGKYVQVGQPLMTIVQQDIWVIANFKETQIKKMSVGQPVDVKVDAYPGMVFKGHVDSIQPGTGSVFSLIPPENATGNFVKVVQRVPVKIVMDSSYDPAHPLWPGLSVEPTVDVSRRTGPMLTGK